MSKLVYSHAVLVGQEGRSQCATSDGRTMEAWSAWNGKNAGTAAPSEPKLSGSSALISTVQTDTASTCQVLDPFHFSHQTGAGSANHWVERILTFVLHVVYMDLILNWLTNLLLQNLHRSEHAMMKEGKLHHLMQVPFYGLWTLLHMLLHVT